MKTFLALLLSCICFVQLLAQQPKLVLPIGHTDRVNAARFSPDSKRFLTASLDNTAKLWDTRTGKLLAVLSGHKQGVSSAEFSPDGKMIFTADGSGAVRIWDAVSANLLKVLREHDLNILSVKFSPDGRKFMTNSSDGTCKIWDINTKKLLYSLICYKQVRTEDASGNYQMEDSEEQQEEEALEDYKEMQKELEEAKRLILKEMPKTAQGRKEANKLIKSLDSLYQIPVKEAKRGAPKIVKFDSLYNSKKLYLKPFEANYAEFSSDGKKVITTATDGTTRIWETETGNRKLDLKVVLSDIKMAKFSKDNLKFLTVSYNGIRVWDAKHGGMLYDIDGHFENGAFFPGENKILATDDEGDITIWNSLNGKFVGKLSGHHGSIKTLKFANGGKKLLTASSDHTAKLWDLSTNKLLRNFDGHINLVSSAQFSSDESKIITSSYDFTAKVWDIAKGNIILDTKGHLATCLSAFFSNDNANIILAYQYGNPKIWSRLTGQIAGDLADSESQIDYAKYSSDDKKIITDSDKSIKIWDSESRKVLKHFGNEEKYEDDIYAKPQLSPNGKLLLKSHLNQLFILDADNGKYLKGISEFATTRFSSPEFSNDGNKILAVHANDKVKIWNLNDFGKFKPETIWDKDPKVLELKGHKEVVNAAKFNFNGQKVVTASDDYSSKIFDAISGKEQKSLIGHTDKVLVAAFSPNGDKVITGSLDGTAKIWDAQKGTMLFDLRGHNALVVAASFSEDNKKVLTASVDNTCKIWDAETGKLKYTFFSIDSLDYFNYLPDGYYLPSREAVKKLHYVTKDLKIISFEQLDVKYNRPDKVLQAIGNTDTSLINSYRRAYEKRIGKLKIDTTVFNNDYSFPEADFINHDIQPEQKKEKLTLRIKGEDKTRKLVQFNVWINEVPVYGLRGIDIRKRNRKDFDTTITLTLSLGVNRIETSVRNENGIESYRMPFEVNYNPEVKPKEMVHFIGIGINEFADKSHNLAYSAKDIRVLAQEMKKKYGNNIIIDTLINRNVTIEKIKALKKKLLKTGVNDKVIMAYSGHGLLDDKKDYYLSTYAVDFRNPKEKGLPYDELENILDSIPARKKLLLIDACHSGEIDKEEMIYPIKTSASEKTKPAKTEKKKAKIEKGGETPENKSPGIRLRDRIELMQSLFVNVAKNTGSTIFTASTGLESAYESNELLHSFFTYYMLEAMKKNTSMKVSKLKEFIFENVEKASNKTQRPTSRSETIAVDWVLW